MSAELVDAASLPSPENGAREEEVKPEATGLKSDVENGTGDDRLEPGGDPGLAPTQAKPAANQPPTSSDMAEAGSDPASLGGEMAKPAKGNGSTPARKKAKRKSSVGIPEHRNRKVNRKKSQVLTNLGARAGDHFLARLRGFPLWPSIVVDESMLPPAMLASRPVTAMKADGTYRQDFADGGKRVNERAFPIMFLETNEFAWIVNTDLQPFALHGLTEEQTDKKTTRLAAAYRIAREQHDLDWFKNLLKEHQESLQAKEKVSIAKATKRRVNRRSGRVVEPDEDVDIDDDLDDMDVDDDNVDEKKPKSKKRKKDVNSDDEDSKPVKTPKRKASAKTATPKLKLSNPKTPNGSGESRSAATKAKTVAKSSKSKVAARKPSALPHHDDDDDEPEDDEASEASEKAEPKPVSVAEKQERRKNELLFLRHKLQRGLLKRDNPPREDEIKAMSDYVQKLESYQNLEASIIRKTKINKVLKGIMKLASIPKDEEFNLRERSKVLLQAWSQVLANEPEGASDDHAADKDDGANGNKKSDESDVENVHDETVVDGAKEAQVKQGEQNPEAGPELDEMEITGTVEGEAEPANDGLKLVETVETTMTATMTTTTTTEADLQHDESTGKTSKSSSFPISAVSTEEVTTTLTTDPLAS